MLLGGGPIENHLEITEFLTFEVLDPSGSPHKKQSPCLNGSVVPISEVAQRTLNPKSTASCPLILIVSLSYSVVASSLSLFVV